MGFADDPPVSFADKDEPPIPDINEDVDMGGTSAGAAAASSLPVPAPAPAKELAHTTAMAETLATAPATVTMSPLATGPPRETESTLAPSSAPVPSTPVPVVTSTPFDASAAVNKLRENGFPYNRNIVALAKMVALYTGRQLRKDDVRTSDWDKPLSEDQQQCRSLLRIN
jgi:hypothetical protein